jgi:predicted transposase YbfD/YdcC
MDRPGGIYHKRGPLETPIATCDVRDVAIAMIPTERALHDAVEDYISTTYDNLAQDERSAVGFVMTIYRRRLASSFHALRQTLTKRLADQRLALSGEDLPQDEQVDEVLDAEEAAEVASRGLVADERASIQGLLKRIAQLGIDTKARHSLETRFYILSRLLSAQEFARAVRGHWGIENRLHWQLDVSFREDECRVYRGHAPANLGVIRRFALGLLKRETSSKRGIEIKRLKCAASDEYREKVLFNS